MSLFFVGFYADLSTSSLRKYAILVTLLTFLSKKCQITFNTMNASNALYRVETELCDQGVCRMPLYFCKFSLYGTFGYFFGMDAGIFFDCAVHQCRP